MRQVFFLLYILLFGMTSCSFNNTNTAYKVLQKEDTLGYSYESIENDPTGLRLYTLENGLKVYLSKNDDEPTIQTYIAVRAGSNYDPKDATGLAHYLEHMLFKGTSKIGTQNWEKEAPYLENISELYEQHKKEEDKVKKKALYKKIDSLSLEASKYSIANEYDKMISSIGAKGTNAHTWFEETVYKNKIPTNELSKWLEVEGERFSELVLRLFHTELEAVYEEFNKGQDNDYRKSYAAMLAGLFPTHPYGQQTTIGTSEHLKNPSMVAIQSYFDTYYVPNNMAVVLVGDIDFEETIQKVDKAFGSYQRKEVNHPKLPVESPLIAVVEKEVFGPTAESVSVSFRTSGIGSEASKYITLIDMLLSNSKAGLIDLNLNQKQLVQGASSSPMFLNDYGVHQLSGSPKEGQSLEEVKKLLLNQIELIKQGDFDAWLIEAVINDLLVNEMQVFENSTALASMYYNAFIHRENWVDRISFIESLKEIDKEKLISFAKNFYKENYVVVYKRKGKDASVVKVENPGITPVHLNRGKQSDFLKEFNKEVSEPLEPIFVDFKKEIQKEVFYNDVMLFSVENKYNDLFSLNFIFKVGKHHDKDLGLAMGYMEYVGTSKYSAEELKKEFYKLGVNYSFNTGAEESTVRISGLNENLPKALKLLEHVWEDAQVDSVAYQDYIQKIVKARSNSKTQKGSILWGGMLNYARYGENSSLRDIYSSEELLKISPEKLLNKIRNLKKYQQQIFYYGNEKGKAVEVLKELHQLPSILNACPEPIVYKTVKTGNQVYFVDYDMVQAEILLVANKEEFSSENLALATVFNSYFGGGLSSIVFQEIRESSSLAYTASASYYNAGKEGKKDMVYAYIGTQANKLPQAIEKMLSLMQNMPEAEKQFLVAKRACLKKIASERITKSSIYWTYESWKERGIDNDYRETIYKEIEKMTLQDLVVFFNKSIKNSSYTTLVLGSRKDLKLEELKNKKVFKELPIDYLFNYR